MERVAAPLKLKTWNLQRHIKSIGWSELASDTLGEIVPEYHQFQLYVASLEYYLFTRQKYQYLLHWQSICYKSSCFLQKTNLTILKILKYKHYKSWFRYFLL